MKRAAGQLDIKVKTGKVSTLFGVMLVFAAFSLRVGSENWMLPLSSSQWVVRLTAYYLCYFGVWRLMRGYSLKRLSGRLLRLCGLFDNDSRVPLPLASRELGASLSTLVCDVREMQRLGMVKGLYADLIRKDLVHAKDHASSMPPGDAPEDNGVILREEKRRSVMPVYAVGISWAVYAIFFPMLGIMDYIVAAILSAIAYVTTSSKAPERTVIFEEIPVIEQPDPTGNTALDEMLAGVQRQISDLRRLDKAIDGKLDAPVAEMLSTTEQIVKRLRENPASASQMRQFFNYTLPTTISLLQNYEELSIQPVKGRNITDAMGKIEGMIDSIVEAFHRQLDALYQDKALNIAVELDVMEKMLQQGGDIFGN